MNKNILFALIFSMFACVQIPVLAAKNAAQLSANDIQSCGDLLASDVVKKNIKIIGKQSVEVNPWAQSKKVAQLYKDSAAWVKKSIPEEQVTELLANFEMGLFMGHLETVLKSLARAGDIKDTTEIKLALLRAFQKLPLNAIEKKIGRGQILQKNIDGEFNLLEALGFRRLTQIQNLIYGSHLEKPSKNSLLGYYAKETGATFRLNRFLKAPGGSRGEARMAVSLSEASFAIFAQLFTLPEFFFHVHTPTQGTLHVSHQGMYGSYADVSDELRTPKLGSLLPMVALSSSEGFRLANYLNLTKIKEIPRDQKDIPQPDADGNVEDNYTYIEGGQAAQEPWLLENYCAKGGYNSCTHWIGNMPIGDKYVSTYTFPGNVDQYAGNADGKGPQSQKLKEYKHIHPFTHVVWQVPGHQQFADVLGLQKANQAGELANPGWVLHTLVGAASADRVPLVFVVVEDHKLELPAEIMEQTRAY